jgi:osmotically-inducible protein OsmY
MKNHAKLLTIMLCALLVAAFVGCAGTKTRESTGQYIDDSAITAKVKAAIFAEESLKTLQITVVTFKGTVQLSGFVDSPAQVVKAGQVTRNVQGVRAIKNDLVVK